jgi:nitroreductase
MDLTQAIKERRSIRQFSDQPVEAEKIKALIEAANWAPSHCNTQAWKFIIVQEDKLKAKMVDAGGSVVIKNAPLGILVLHPNTSENIEYYDYIQSCSAAIQNILLTAYSLGLGSCWICHLPRRSVIRKIFSIPKNYLPVAYILIGYPAKEAQPVARINQIPDLISYNKFDFKVEKANWLKIKSKRAAKRIYRLLPTPLKKLVFPLVDKLLVKKFDN